MRTILDNFIAEVGIHRWDVIYPFDPHVQLSPEGVAAMQAWAEMFLHAYRGE